MLSKIDILRGLDRIDQEARRAGVVVDLAIYGGAALAITFDLRQATRDVDAVVSGDPAFLRGVVAEVAADYGWPPDWLNDGVKGFLSAHEKLQAVGQFQGSGQGGLRLYVPTPEYLFAMKAMAMRTGGLGAGNDVPDIEALAEILQLKQVGEALALIEDFYPAGQIPAKVRFGVEEIIQRVIARRVTPSP
jgi:hypothetical protein